jgi:mannose-6-phosphate isomerase-like protein (cupin superfamily)
MNIQDSNTNDAVNIAPHLHEILYEDDRMRVLKVTVNPGDEAQMHSHPHNINYVLKAGKLQFEKPDGTTVEVELTKGQVTSSLIESSHAVKNTGDRTVQTIQVELKY